MESVHRALLNPPAEAAQRSPGPEEGRVDTIVSHRTLDCVSATQLAPCPPIAGALEVNGRGIALARAGAPSAASAATAAITVPLAGRHDGVLQVGRLGIDAAGAARSAGNSNEMGHATGGVKRKYQQGEEYKRKQAAAAAKRRRTEKERVKAMEERVEMLSALAEEQAQQIERLLPYSQQQQIDAAERARAKAERAAKQALEACALAQASSSRLADRLQVQQAVASTAAHDVRRAMQDAGKMRAALSRARAEQQVAVDKAVARALHSTELEQRQLRKAHVEELHRLRAHATKDHARARAAEAQAEASNVVAVAVDAKAKADRKKCRALEDEVRRLKYEKAAAAAAAAKDATHRAMAMLGNSSSDSDSEAGSSAGSGGDGGGGCGGGGGGKLWNTSEACRDDGEWRAEDEQLTAPSATRKRVSAQPLGLRTDEDKIRGMRAATSGASYAQIATIAASSDELRRISERRYLQRSAADARIIGLLLHGVELCSAIKRISIKADGFSMHTQDGLLEFVTYTHTLMNARGKLLELPLDGFLMSQGLTAADEVGLCDRSLIILKVVIAVLREMYCKLFGKESCPAWLHEDRVDLASFSHIGADGANAAQKWARLMKERVQEATKARIGNDSWQKLSAIEQAREMHVQVTKCCIHGGVLGFSWGSKAAAKLTVELGAGAVASVRETGRASDHFAHACNLKQALHCGGKLLGCSNGYAFGKAHYFFVVFQRPHFAHLEYIAWPRQNGSRFFGTIRMCAVFLRTREVALEALSTLMLGSSLSKIVSSYWSQVNSPVLAMEARVSEAMMAALGEPAQVLLGQGAFDSGSADGDTGWKSVLDTELLDLLGAADGSAAPGDGDECSDGEEDAVNGEGIAAASNRVVSLTASAAPFVRWHAGADDHSLPAYRAALGQGARAEIAEAFRDASVAEVLAVLGGCDGGSDTALALIDGGEHAEPCAGTCGVWETVDVISGLIRAARAFAEQPSLVFDGCRPSDRLRHYLPVYATQKLKEWEDAVYKRPSKNASGIIIGASSRASADAWRKEPPQLCAELEADGTRDKYAAAMFGACADEWEKYFASALQGDMAVGGRVGWMGDKIRGAKFDTAFVESTNGAAKHVCQQMQGRGAHSRQVARVLASQADMWGRWDALDGQMQRAMIRSIPSLREKVDAFTSQSKKLNAQAEVGRKERQQRAAVKAAAKSYAIAQALHSFDLWSAPKLTKELHRLKFKYQQQDALEQQLAIIVTGYGFDECAFTPQKGDAFCSFCGADLGKCSRLEHLELHVKRAIQVVQQHGKPVAAPLPDLCVKQACFAPVLDEDQSKNPLYEVMTKLSEEAKAMAPKIAVAVAPVIAGDASAPAFDKKMEGLVIEYVFRIAERGARKKKSQLYTYQGYVESIEVVDRGKPNEHALAVCVWPTTLRDGVFVEEKERETCMLFAKYYGKKDPNGWVVYKGKMEADAAAAEAEAVPESFESKMHERKVETDMLCAYE